MLPLIFSYGLDQGREEASLGLSLLSLHFLHLLYSICQSITLALHPLGESSKILRIVVLQASLAPFPLSFSLLPLAPALDFDSHRLKGFFCLIRGAPRRQQVSQAISPCFSRLYLQFPARASE